MTTPARPSTAVELLQDPEVVRAMEQAWTDSLPDDAARRHEEGGWIYQNVKTGMITTVRAPSGGQASLNFANPPLVSDSVIVGTFHTHPNPAADGWHTGPSSSDQANANYSGVPWLILAEDGYHSAGPDSRRGGLSGKPGFPI